MRWFVDITSWEPIAMDLRQLVRAFDAGRIDADTLVWRKGMPDWRRLRDVSELAERLVGGSEGNTAKLPSEPPPEAPGALASRSEPPPRQAERSRTPPASYTVGARSGSEPPGAGGPATSPGVGSSSSAPPPVVEVSRERASVAPSGEAARVSGAAPAATPASDAPRPQSRRNRSRSASSPKAAPVPSRVITQPGFESPAEVAARNATGPLPSDGEQATAGTSNSSLPPGEAPEASRQSAATGSGNRHTRATTPAGGIRRPSSNDETPAQKPSSISVPPGAITTIPTRPRVRRMLALAAVVLGALVLIRQLSTSTDGAASTAQHRVDAVTEPKRVDDSEKKTPEKTAQSHAASAPAAAVTTTTSTAGARAEVAPPAASPVGMTVAASTQEDVPVSGAVREATSPNVRIAPVPTPAAPAPKAAVPPPIAAPAPKAAFPPPVAAARPAPAAPVKAAAPRAPVVAAAPRAAPPPGDAVATAPRAPRPFDEVLATEQFQVAASKAAACGQAGPTRGSGRVRVVIQPWGRVGRVTHLNPEFADTEVGACVSQAFQQIQLPAFDGNTRSIAGDFVIQ